MQRRCLIAAALIASFSLTLAHGDDPPWKKIADKLFPGSAEQATAGPNRSETDDSEDPASLPEMPYETVASDQAGPTMVNVRDPVDEEHGSLLPAHSSEAPSIRAMASSKRASSRSVSMPRNSEAYNIAAVRFRFTMRAPKIIPCTRPLSSRSLANQNHLTGGCGGAPGPFAAAGKRRDQGPPRELRNGLLWPSR